VPLPDFWLPSISSMGSPLPQSELSA